MIFYGYFVDVSLEISRKFRDILTFTTTIFTKIDIYVKKKKKINIYRNFYGNFMDILWKKYDTPVSISVVSNTVISAEISVKMLIFQSLI